jgi:hypothetical protein
MEVGQGLNCGCSAKEKIKYNNIIIGINRGFWTKLEGGAGVGKMESFHILL